MTYFSKKVTLFLTLLFLLSINYTYSQQTKESQSKIDPDKAFQMLKDGNKRFTEGKMLHKDYMEQVKETAEGQFPFAVILSCMDSRVFPSIIFDQDFGDIFVIRIAGNVVDEDVLGSLEYACKVTGAKLIVVLGHTNCGAIKGACDDAKLGNLTQLLSKIKPAVDSTQTTGVRSSKNHDFVEEVAELNVNNQIEIIRKPGTVLGDMLDKSEIGIVGAMYDVETGKVQFYVQ